MIPAVSESGLPVSLTLILLTALIVGPPLKALISEALTHARTQK